MCTYVIYACLYNACTSNAVTVFHIQHIMQHRFVSLHLNGYQLAALNRANPVIFQSTYVNLKLASCRFFSAFIPYIKK